MLLILLWRTKSTTLKSKIYSHQLFCIVLLLFTLASGLLSAQDHRVTKLDSMLNPLAEKDLFSGVVLLAEGENIIYQRAFGWADRAAKQPLTTNSVFELASVSKQFTAAAIMLLHKEGKLQFTDKVSMHLPQLQAYPEVTISNLIYHTGGLPDYMELVDKHWDTANIITNAEVLNLFAQLKPKADFKPGKRFDYSNTGYLILASLIEKISGMDYGDYLAKTIFQPLKMKRTSVYRRRFAPRKIDDYALGYVKTSKGFLLPDDEPSNNFVIYLDGIVGDGMVNSTIGDLFLWDRALTNHTLFTPAETNTIFTPGTTTKGKSTDYAFGWQTGRLEPIGEAVLHSGGWPGYVTMIERHLDSNKTIIVLRNDSGAPTEEVNPYRNIRRILYNFQLKALEMPVPVIAVDEQEATKYLGIYSFKKRLQLTITWQDNYLHAQVTGQEAVMIDKTDEHTFSVNGVDAKIIFYPNAEGGIEKLVLLQDGKEIMGVKERK